MAAKILFGVIAVVLMAGYNSVVAIKLKEIPLVIVILIGIGMMLWDLWDSLKSKED